MKRVFLVDDEYLAIEGLRRLVDWKKYDMEVCGVAGDGKSGREMILAQKPDIVFSDIRMPGMSGLDAQKIMKDRGFVLPIIFLSAHGDIDTAVDTMRLGAFDFIQKPIDPERMTKTVERAIRESIRRSRGILSSEVIAERVNLLTHRERQILQFAQAGLTNKKIAEALNIREKTVESFKTSIFKRFGATSMKELRTMLGMEPKI